MPTYSGGTTTPTNRGDVLLGGAYRVPTGDLARSEFVEGSPEHTAQTILGREGASPVGMSRYGFSEDADFTLGVSLTQVALTGRGAIHLDKISRARIIVGITPTLGWLGVGGVRGFSLGAQLPILATIQISGMYEGWAGIRAGVDLAQGRVDEIHDARAIRGSVGAVVGFSVGFRMFAALVEVAVDYEHWNARANFMHRSFEGISVTPAFALRIRI